MNQIRGNSPPWIQTRKGGCARNSDPKGLKCVLSDQFNYLINNDLCSVWVEMVKLINNVVKCGKMW